MTAAAAPERRPFLQARGLRKSYGHVRAIHEVDLTVLPGEVLALVGDNGAGKSTLVKMLCGALTPDEGEIVVEGEPVTMRGYREAAARGIAVVYQDLALVDQRDVATNIFLGREPGGFFVNRRRMRKEAAEVIGQLQFNLPSLRASAGQLSGGQRQAVAIARAIHQGGRLVIMDEPTAALGVDGQRKVLELIDDLRNRGSTVIVISHNLDHVFAIADRIVVLRRGRVAGVRTRSETSVSEIVGLIVGGDAAPSQLKNDDGD